MREHIRRLPDTEQEVMQAVWACTPPVSRAEIEEILFKTHPMAMTTLLTLLTRLRERGFLAVEKQGRGSRYIPLISQEDYLASQGEAFFKKLCGGDLSVFASALCGSGLTKDELDQLRALLERGGL